MNFMQNRNQTFHKAMIAQLVARLPNPKTSGFWTDIPALAEVVASEDFPVQRHAFVPDVFVIDRQSETIEIHEVVNTHHPKRETLMAMGGFWFWWATQWSANCDWEVRAFVHREGCSTPAEIDLEYWYHRGAHEDHGGKAMRGLDTQAHHAERDIEIARLSPQHKKEEDDAE